MTPATVQQAFARAGVPVVRYGQSPELCGKGVCRGLEYTGSGIRAYLAPRVGPTFEVIVFRTPADAQQVAKLVHGPRNGNAVLYGRPLSARIRGIFAKIRP